MSSKRSVQAVVIFTAAFITLAGCATKRDVMIVDERVQRVEVNQKKVVDAVGRIDSLLADEKDASTDLRAEVRSSVRDMLTEFRAMQVSLTDLQSKVDALTQRGQGREGYIPPVTIAGSDTTRPSDSVAVIPAVDCQEMYDEAFILLRQSQYEEAIASFGEYFKYCANSDKADNARFWLGEAYYSMKKYMEAISEFDLLLKNYPKSEKCPGAMYKIARSHEELGHAKDARQYYQKLVDEYPGTLEADQAAEKLKELK